jgi:hypothetical protein
MLRLFIYSVLTVAFTYVVAEIIDVIVQMVETDPNETFSVSNLKAFAVAVTPWPPAVVWTVVLEVAGIGLLGIARIAELQSLQKFITFVSKVACAIAWVATVLLGLSTIGDILFLLLNRISPSSQYNVGTTPVPFMVTTVITMGLCLGLARFFPKVREAITRAF